MFQNVSKRLDVFHCQLFQGFTSPPGTKNCTKKKAESLFQPEKAIFSWKKPSFFSGIQKFIPKQAVPRKSTIFCTRLKLARYLKRINIYGPMVRI
jgi:hypothetical protein